MKAPEATEIGEKLIANFKKLLVSLYCYGVINAWVVGLFFRRIKAARSA